MTEKLEAFDTSVIYSESESNRTCNPLLGMQILYLNQAEQFQLLKENGHQIANSLYILMYLSFVFVINYQNKGY